LCGRAHLAEGQSLRWQALQIAPNSTSDDFDISFTLKQSSHTNLLIYNYLGKQVQIINAGILSAGHQQQTINVYDLPTGLYVLQMDAEDVHISKTFMKK
jgi:hypothetical protein